MATLDQLIRHCELYFSDAMLAADFDDCVMPEASPLDRTKLEAYGRLRREDRGFQSRSYSHNNHREIIERFNRWLGDYGSDDRKSCEQCAAPLATLARSDARFCSARCGAKARRRRSTANVDFADTEPQVRAL